VGAALPLRGLRVRVDAVRKLLQIGESSLGVLGFFPVRVELKVGLELGDGFFFFLQLLRDLGEGEVSGGVVGLDGNGIFGAEVGALIVFVAQIELCHGEIFVYAFVVGLDSLDLGKFAMDGGAFGRIRRVASFGGWVVVGRGIGVVAAGAGAAAAGVVAGKFGRRLGRKWMLGGGIGGGGCSGRGVRRVRGLGDFAGEGELLGGGWLLCGWRGRRAGLGCLIRRLCWGLVGRRTGSGRKGLGGGGLVSGLGACGVGKARGAEEDGCVQGSKDWAN
jgi:hypothetical protein